MSTPRTLLDKIWDAHEVAARPGHPSVLYIDLHLIHEVTSPQAFSALAQRGLRVRRVDRTLATMDHSTPTFLAGEPDNFVVDEGARAQLARLEENCREHGIALLRRGGPDNGIVHVVGPERGRTLPGTTIVCGDSHTSTHGAFGALAFGIGTTEVLHVLATQCLLQRKPAAYQVRFDGVLPAAVGAKDMALALIATIGTDGGTGCAFEFCGDAVRALDMEGRMTLCNMSIEAGARAGMIAPDETTFAYLADRPEAPRKEQWERALSRWRGLRSDPGSDFSRRVAVDAATLRPMITFGTSPEMAVPVDGEIPSDGPVALEHALRYMGLDGGRPIAGTPIDVVFIGSCTNGRLSDLRAAAQVLAGRRVHRGVRLLVVPGSMEVKRQAEAEGLHRVIAEAGGEWRSPGCSMCIAMNGDRLEPGQRAVSTSNRNFEGRQGPGGRTLLASPATAAAAAIYGAVCDPRVLLAERVAPTAATAVAAQGGQR